MSDLRELYQEVIIDHNRSPRNYGCLENASCEAEGFNPLCGDKLTLYLRLDNGVIKDVSFEGSGCAISTASASLMTEYLKGKTEIEARELFNKFHSSITSEIKHDLGKLEVLLGVKEFPNRVKCATLAWHTLCAALNNEDGVASTE